MKHAQKIELRKASVKDLEAKATELHKDLQSFHLQKATNQLGQTHLLATTRRDLARVKTFLQQAKLAEQKGKQAS